MSNRKYKALSETMERVTNEYRLPAHWAAYLVNGDATGYEPDELERIEDWEHEHQDEYCVAIDDEIDFCVEGDDDELACKRRLYVFEKTQPFGDY
tara:strand:+ start:506 stop:790 length:285 start_codon:yes stop_codon:yes gene_type:complete